MKLPVQDAKGKDTTRVVLKLHPRLAPIKAAVLPLVKKDGMPEKAEFTVTFESREVGSAITVSRFGFGEGEDAGLVVVGSRGRTGLQHLALGSVAERTLRHAPCSVWTTRRGE